MPKVTVIVPTHKPSQFLLDALSSVVAQTYPDWELLLVADGIESDLSYLTEKFPMLKILKQPKLGVSVARNTGIMNASGEYIAFLDHDDLWLPSKLAGQVAILDAHQDVAVTHCHVSHITDDATIEQFQSEYPPQPYKGIEGEAVQIHLGPGFHGSRLRDSIQYFKSRFTVPATVMIRKSCIEQVGLLDPLLPFTGDYDLLIRIGWRFKVAEWCSQQTLYRVHSENFSRQYQVCKRELGELIRRYESLGKFLPDKEIQGHAARLFSLPSEVHAAQAFDHCRAAWRERDARSFVYHLAQASLMKPTFVAKSVNSYFQKRLQQDQ